MSIQELISHTVHYGGLGMPSDPELARERFIRDHHHLINPAVYAKATLAARDQVLLRRQMEKAKR